jgi:DNA replication protein DnaC
MTSTTIHKTTCVDCGVAVEIELPEDEGIFGEFLRKIPRRCPAHRVEAEAAWAAADREAEMARMAALVQGRERECGLPVGLRRIKLDELDTVGRERSIALVRLWAEGGEDAPKGLLLAGAVGRGKTYAAAAAAWYRLRFENLRWTSASALVTSIDSGFGTEARARAMALVAGHGALVLDDLDKARPTEHVAEQLLAAIDNRVNHGARLLVTMNTTPTELATRLPEPFGEAIVSRLVGYCASIQLGGPDRRVS